MSSQDNRDNSSSGAVNRRNILLASTTLGVASALGSTALAQITRALAQTAQEPVHVYRDNAMSSHAELQARLSVAAQFPVHFFLENIAVRHDNSMLITVVTPKELYFLPPPRTDAEVEPVLLHTFDELATGIAELEPDLFVVISTNAYTTHENYLHRVDLRGWNPSSRIELEQILAFPKEVLALNGCCALSPMTILAADSLAGAIWRIDFDGDGRSPRAKLWLQHESMAHVEDNLPPPPQPGINGLRYSAETGYVYYTTTGQKLFMRVRVDPATLEPADVPERIWGGGMYDDFCIDEGRRAAYVTVHRENRIDHISLAPGEEAMRPLAGSPFDELLLGPSSAAWSRAPDEAGRVVYVTTDGGQTAPPPGTGVRNAKVLRMELV